ncbi:MAG: transglutaminase-like domain-containing protein [Myxococcales bacterium]|nr:transglutaminase-like domain-containing protein [Polyangiaceae bacterium]MDW8248467.1 transglutaminase-like domain-containing protein [Myxococcales bacterium]
MSLLSSRLSWVILLVTTATATTLAAGPMLHEYIPPDPREDLQLGATTTVGDLPAAIETPGGPVSAPDPFRLPSLSEKAYSRSVDGNTFIPDRDTRPVTQVDYDDPFAPSVAPFKRLYAFDAVTSSASFFVGHPELERVPVGGNLQPGEDPFYGDITVDLVPGEAIRIPTVGPRMRILKLHTVPQTSLEVLRDGADNYFVRGLTRQRVRVLLHASIPRASLGGPLNDALWGDLPLVTPLPAGLQVAAEEVNRQIGVSRAQSFHEVVERLVGYYRSFIASEAPLPVRGNVFLDVALAKKGVCRHRAFSFVISALALRIPARMVTNEAHAWVEVHDGTLWHRIDLGGAAMNFNDSSAQEQPVYTPPADPFPWPPGAGPGDELARRNRSPGTTGSGGAGSRSGPASSAVPVASAATTGGGSFEDERPPSRIALSFLDREVIRNQALHLEGRVESSGAPCPHVRLDVALVLENAEVPLGALATDDEGRFQGAVVIPSTIRVGEHELVLSTPGDLRCGRGRLGDAP